MSAAAAEAPRCEVRVAVRPAWTFRLPRTSGMDGVLRCRAGVLHRLLHRGEEPVVVRVAQPAPDRVVFAAEAPSEETAAWGIERMRFALGVDDDLRPFYERFKDDPLIGRAVRAQPGLRLRRRPLPFEALAWAITEQLIEYARAAEIQRRIVRRLGRRCPRTGLRDLPSPARLAAESPALLRSFDLADRRVLALRRAAREVARGRIDLDGPDHETAWRRLRAIPDIGRWTTEVLALLGQGRMDQLPANDLAYRKLVGRLRTGDPRARADEEDVRAFFAPYAPWAGLAAAYALRAVAPRMVAMGAAA